MSTDDVKNFDDVFEIDYLVRTFIIINIRKRVLFVGGGCFEEVVEH